MESINKLREYVKEHTNSEWAYATAPPKYPLVNCADVDLLDIADAIEQEVEDVCAEAYGNGVQSVALPDMTTYVKLPVDADGVPIHVGDVMEWVDEPGVTRTVTSIQLANDGWWVYISGTGRRPDKYRHHHAPTVEDVLREFAYGLGVPVADSYIAASAAKLRLAEGEDA